MFNDTRHGWQRGACQSRARSRAIRTWRRYLLITRAADVQLPTPRRRSSTVCGCSLKVCVATPGVEEVARPHGGGKAGCHEPTIVVPDRAVVLRTAHCRLRRP